MSQDKGIDMTDRQIRQFVDGYVECALWASTDDNDDPLERNYDYGDIAASSLESMRADCVDFIQGNEDDLTALYDDRMGSAGHDFWLTRNRHGAGFWDRGNDPGYRRLTDNAHPYGSSDLYVGDDGLIYVA